MTTEKRILVLGGDSRQIYMSQYLRKNGARAVLFGFDNIKQEKPELEFDDLEFASGSLKDEISKSDIIILPLPVTRDNSYLNCAFSKKNVKLSEIVRHITKDHIVFGGMIKDELFEKLSKKAAQVTDYFLREDLSVLNAIPTAEGVLGIIIDKLPITIHSSECAVTGFGRTGKAVGRSLRALGAKVTVSARSTDALANAISEGHQVCPLSELYKQAHKFDVLINTIPSLVIDKKILQNLRRDCLIIEIASAPFGVDFAGADRLGINVIKAGSLPGKVAPKTAGKIISDTLINILKEGEK